MSLRVRQCPGWLWAVALPVFLLAHEAGAAERVVVQLSYLHQFQFAGIYAAEAKGYFREAGLDVTIDQGEGSGATVENKRIPKFFVNDLISGAVTKPKVVSTCDSGF